MYYRAKKEKSNAHPGPAVLLIYVFGYSCVQRLRLRLVVGRVYLNCQPTVHQLVSLYAQNVSAKIFHNWKSQAFN